MSKKSAMIGFKTTPEVKEKLEEIAEKEDRSVSYIINKIISEYLTNEKEEKQNE